MSSKLIRWKNQIYEIISLGRTSTQEHVLHLRQKITQASKILLQIIHAIILKIMAESFPLLFLMRCGVISCKFSTRCHLLLLCATAAPMHLRKKRGNAIEEHRSASIQLYVRKDRMKLFTTFKTLRNYAYDQEYSFSNTPLSDFKIPLGQN